MHIVPQIASDTSPPPGAVERAAAVELAQIPFDLIDAAWPYAAPLLAAAHRRMGGDNPAKLYDRLKARKCDLWFACNPSNLRPPLAAMITTIVGDTVFIETLGGHDMRRWTHLLAEYEDLARQHGMKHIEIEGRPGWARVFPDYETKKVIFGKAL